MNKYTVVLMYDYHESWCGHVEAEDAASAVTLGQKQCAEDNGFEGDGSDLMPVSVFLGVHQDLVGEWKAMEGGAAVKHWATSRAWNWGTSKDAVPPGWTQVTVYDENGGARIATVFNAEAVPLIQAAPDMLAALESLVNAASWTPTDNWRIGPMDSSKGGKMDMARAAIAKAKGLS